MPLSKTAQTFTCLPTERVHTPLLDSINHSHDLKQLTNEQLLTLADELRAYLLYAIGISGGHFGANLGVIELTIALHYLLDMPDDKVLWDVGHQAYAHKVLTGRREAMTSIRAQGGLHPFPCRDESNYDAFGVGHSSTVISAGLGISLAFRYQKQSQKVVCVVGDGAMSAGMAFEAMNDAVQHNADLLVILNDNDMSISHSTGGISHHLAQLWHAHGNSDYPQSIDNLFTAIGFEYFGIYDGHNLPQLITIISDIIKLDKPVLLHIKTIKGKGFLPAEQDPIGYHAIDKIQRKKAINAPLTYSQVFGQFLCDKASNDPLLFAITPAMQQGSGMKEFSQRFADRYYDVAIAEQHAVTLAGGMATQGIKPIVALYSTFLQRGYDQFIHDIAVQNLDVTFAIDRSGLVGEDGATHAGVFDMAFLRCIPNVILACATNENDCYHLLNTCYEYQGVSVVRYPRGQGLGVAIDKPLQRYAIGKAVLEQHYSSSTLTVPSVRLAILAFGSMVATAHSVAKRLSVDSNVSMSVVNMRWVKPLDEAMIDTLMGDYSHFATLEEHVIMGGAGSAINEYILNKNHALHRLNVINIGIDDRHIHHASHQEQLADCGLDDEGVYQKLKAFVMG